MESSLQLVYSQRKALWVPLFMFLSWKQGPRVFMHTRAYADGEDNYPTSTRDEGLLGVLNPLLRVLQTDCGRCNGYGWGDATACI